MYNSNFIDTNSSSGIDLTSKYVTKQYMMDNFPNLAPSIKSATVYAWGVNNVSRLGLGASLTNTVVTVPTLLTAGQQHNWKYLDIGDSQSIGIRTDGTVWAAGESAQNKFQNVVANGQIAHNFVQIDAGDYKKITIRGRGVYAIKSDGHLWRWGEQTSGGASTAVPVEEGTGTFPWTDIHGAIAQAGSSILNGVCNGKLRGAGYNGYLGYGGGGAQSYYDLLEVYEPTVRTDFIKSEANGVYFCGALTSTGELFTAGYGDPRGYTIYHTQESTSATDWKDFSIGVYHAGAIKKDGSLWLWGANTHGELGITKSITGLPAPSQVPGGNWRKVICGNACTMALKNDGTVWMCGINTNNFLGIINGGVDVVSLTQLTSAPPNVVDIAGGCNGYNFIYADAFMCMVEGDL